MQYTFHDQWMNQVAICDNDLTDALHADKADITNYFEEMTSTLDIVLNKDFGDWGSIQKNGYISTLFKGKLKRYKIIDFRETKTKIEISADFLNLEFLNENCIAYENQPARTLLEHFKSMGILPYAGFEIAVNEVADKKIQLTYTGEESKLKRMVSIISNFDAEGVFEIQTYADGTFKNLLLNIVKENDGEGIQGVGQDRRDFEITVDNTDEISYTTTSEGIYTAIEPRGKVDDNPDSVLYLNSIKNWQNSDGRVEFSMRDRRIYAEIAAEQNPAVFGEDSYILRHQDIDTKSVSKLETEALKLLKANCYPKETLEVEGDYDLDAGDTVTVNFKGIERNGLLGTVRVSKTVTDTLNDITKVTFSNFKKAKSMISGGSLDKQQSLQTDVYDVQILSTEGTVFKNNGGQTELSYLFLKNGTITEPLRQIWYINDELVSLDERLIVGSDKLVNDKAVIKLELKVDSNTTHTRQVTLVNINDGNDVDAKKDIAKLSNQVEEKLDSKEINFEENGLVTQPGKLVDGGTFANMIAANVDWAQKIGDKILVNHDMIVDGAITAEKLKVDKLSALSADLGNVTSGRFTNTVLEEDGTVSSAAIDSELHFSKIAPATSRINDFRLNDTGLTMQQTNLATGSSVYSFAIGNLGLAFTSASGGKASSKQFSMTFDGQYTVVKADYIKQNTRMEYTLPLPYGLVGRVVRIGDVVTVTVERRIVSFGVGEDAKAIETVWYGYRPVTDTNMLVAGNTGSNVSGVMILHFKKNGEIRFTNGITGNRVWSGTTSWVTSDQMPIDSSVDNQ